MKRTGKQIQRLTRNRSRPEDEKARIERRGPEQTLQKERIRRQSYKDTDTVINHSHAVERNLGGLYDRNEIELSSRRRSKSEGRASPRYRTSKRQAILDEERHRRNLQRRMDVYERSTDDDRTSTDSGDSFRGSHAKSPVRERPIVRPSERRSRSRNKDYVQDLSPQALSRHAREPRGAKYSLLDVEANYYEDAAYNKIYQSYNLSPRVPRKGARNDDIRSRYSQEEQYQRKDRRRRPLSGSRKAYPDDNVPRPRSRVEEMIVADDGVEDVLVGRYGKQLLEVEVPFEDRERVRERGSRGRRSPRNYPVDQMVDQAFDQYYLGGKKEARSPRNARKSVSGRRSLREVGRRQSERHAGPIDFSDDDDDDDEGVLDPRFVGRRSARHPIHPKNLKHDLLDSVAMRSESARSTSPEDLLCDSEACDDLGMLDTPNLSPGYEEFCDIMYDQNIPKLATNAKTDSMNVNLSCENIVGENTDHTNGDRKGTTSSMHSLSRERSDVRIGTGEEKQEVYAGQYQESVLRNANRNHAASIDTNNKKKSERKHVTPEKPRSIGKVQEAPFKNNGFWYHLPVDEHSNESSVGRGLHRKPQTFLSPEIVVEEVSDNVKMAKIVTGTGNLTGDGGYCEQSMGKRQYDDPKHLQRYDADYGKSTAVETKDSMGDDHYYGRFSEKSIGAAETKHSLADDGYHGRSIEEVSNYEDGDYETERARGAKGAMSLQKLESGIWSESAETYSKTGTSGHQVSRGAEKDQHARDLFLGICNEAKTKVPVTNSFDYSQSGGKRNALTRSLSMRVNPSSAPLMGAESSVNTTDTDGVTNNIRQAWRSQKAYSVDWADRCCPNNNYQDLYILPEMGNTPEMKITVQKSRRYRNITIACQTITVPKAKEKKKGKKKGTKTANTTDKENVRKSDRAMLGGNVKYGNLERSSQKSTKKEEQKEMQEKVKGAKLAPIGGSKNAKEREASKNEIQKSEKTESHARKKGTKSQKSSNEDVSPRGIKGKQKPRERQQPYQIEEQHKKDRARKKEHSTIREEEEPISDEENKKSLISKLIKKKLEAKKLRETTVNCLKKEEGEQREEEVVSDEETKKSLLTKLIRKKKESIRSKQAIDEEKKKTSSTKPREEDVEISDEERKTSLISKLIRKKKEARANNEINNQKLKDTTLENDVISDEEAKTKLLSNLIRRKKEAKRRQEDEKDSKTEVNSKIANDRSCFQNKRIVDEKKNKSSIDKRIGKEKQKDSSLRESKTKSKGIKEETQGTIVKANKKETKALAKMNTEKEFKNEKTKKNLLKGKETQGKKGKQKEDGIGRKKEKEILESKSGNNAADDNDETTEDYEQKVSLIGRLLRKKIEAKEEARRRKELEEQRLKAIENLKKPFGFSEDELTDASSENEDASSEYEGASSVYEEDSNDGFEEMSGNESESNSSEEVYEEESHSNSGNTEYETGSEEENEVNEKDEGLESETEEEDSDREEIESEEETEDEISEYESESQEEDAASSEEETDGDINSGASSRYEEDDSEGEEEESEYEETESEEATGSEEATESEEEESETDDES